MFEPLRFDCSLLHNIHVIAYLLIASNMFIFLKTKTKKTKKKKNKKKKKKKKNGFLSTVFLHLYSRSPYKSGSDGSLFRSVFKLTLSSIQNVSDNTTKR